MFIETKLNKISHALCTTRFSTINKGLCASALLSFVASPAFADSKTSEIKIKNNEIEVVQVTSMRSTITHSLNEKKNTDAIVDAIASTDFDELPGLSISDVIKNITYVSGHGGKGSGLKCLLVV
jgi:hypothetical protein